MDTETIQAQRAELRYTVAEQEAIRMDGDLANTVAVLDTAQKGQPAGQCRSNASARTVTLRFRVWLNVLAVDEDRVIPGYFHDVIRRLEPESPGVTLVLLQRLDRIRTDVPMKYCIESVRLDSLRVGERGDDVSKCRRAHTPTYFSTLKRLIKIKISMKNTIEPTDPCHL